MGPISATRVISFSALIAAACALPFGSGCGNSTPSTFGDADAGLGDETGATGDSGDPMLPPSDGGGEGGGCSGKCSSDLHSVTDCNGVVKQTCTGTDGCDLTTLNCTNACAAAVNNKQSVGCEYYATHMDTLEGATYCFAAFVANTWDTPVHINVDFNGKTLNVASFTRIPSGSGQSLTYSNYDAATGLPPGQVAILFLAGDQGSIPQCPIATAEGTAAMVQGTGKGHSFHISTDVPVVAYEMNPYGGGSVAVTGASLLLPVSAWDTNYVANTASPDTVSPPSINVIAAQDSTMITLLPTVAISGGNGIPSGPANKALTFTLNKGEQAQIEESNDMVGSILQSTKPIGLMAGNPCMNMPQGVVFCDHGEQMVPPVRALGSEYVGVMYRPRANEPAIWRVIGAVDGTTLSYSPSITGAPKTLKRGQMVEFNTGTPFVVTSQDKDHPFEMFAYMSGSSWSELTDTSGYGDPDFAVVVPPQQYMSRYVFMTDPTFPETNLVIIRAKDDMGNFHDVTLDCLGKLTNWTAVGSSYEWTRTDLSTGDFKGVGKCNTGRHEMSSDGLFGLWVWGWGTPLTSIFTANVSYAYPAGMNIQPINSVVIPPTPQ